MKAAEAEGEQQEIHGFRPKVGGFLDPKKALKLGANLSHSGLRLEWGSPICPLDGEGAFFSLYFKGGILKS